jgi:hypothetical protein
LLQRKRCCKWIAALISSWTTSTPSRTRRTFRSSGNELGATVPLRAREPSALLGIKPLVF